MLRTTLALILAATSTGCAFHSTATEWNQRLGDDGDPVFYTTTTKVGAKLGIVLPFLGRLGIDGLVEEMTGSIAERGGDRVRIVQGSSENYWYGFPPVTWILTPVVSTIAAEYHPSENELLEAMVELEREADHNATEEQVQERAAQRASAWMERAE